MTVKFSNAIILIVLLSARAAPSVPAAVSCQTLLDDASLLNENHTAAARYNSESYFVDETLFKQQGCLKYFSDAHLRRQHGHCRTESLLQHYKSQKP